MAFVSTERGQWIDGMLYDIMRSPRSGELVVELISDLASAPGPILDIGAGSGRHALPLALKGFDVTCIEPSVSMRTALLTKVAEAFELRERVTVLPKDACSFRADRRFIFAYALEMAGYLDENAFVRAVSNIWEHLVSGGMFLLDGLDAENSVHDSNWILECRRMVGHDSIELWWRYENVSANACTLATSYRCSNDDNVASVDRRYNLFLRSRQRVLEMLAETGFELVDEMNTRVSSSGDIKNAVLLRRPHDS